MKGFVLPIILLLLAMILLSVYAANYSIMQSSRLLNTLKLRQQLLTDARTQIMHMAEKLMHRQSASAGLRYASLLSSKVVATSLNICEQRAYWLDAELIWQNLKLRVSSRWALFTNAGDNCAQFMPGWRQTDWKET